MEKKRTIPLGRTKKGKTVFINPKERTTHMHVIGSTGEGKSKFMEHMIRQDIINDEGLCLIDPHGSLYHNIVRWCETHRMFDRKKIILFDPSQDGWTFGFNPLKIDSPELSFHIDTMVKAVAQVWGGENTDKTPLLKRVLRNVFFALSRKKLSLVEAQYLLSPTNDLLRKYLTDDIDPIDNFLEKDFWDYMNIVKPQRFMDDFGSAVNRMTEFLSAPLVKNTIGQIDSVIDLREVMDEGGILLVNLSAEGKLSDDNSRLLGTLIVNDLFMKCPGRPEGSRPFYLFIDECARYINDDIARILDEGRKFGLHLIMANQHLAQLSEVSEIVYRSVMTDAKTKVIFGGLSADDAKTLAEQIFLGEINLEEVKKSITTPVTIDHIKRIVKNWSETDTVTDGSGTSEGTSLSHGGSRSTTRTIGESDTVGNNQSFSRGIQQDSGGGVNGYSQTFGQGHSTGRGKSKSFAESEGSNRSRGESRSSSESHSESHGETHGEGEAFVPKLEERATQAYSLQEQIHKAMAVLVNQPTQHAIIKLPKKITRRFKVAKVEPGVANLNRVKDFKQKCYQKSDFAVDSSKAREIIKQRLMRLTRQAKERAMEKEKASVKQEPESFREKPPKPPLEVPDDFRE